MIKNFYLKQLKKSIFNLGLQRWILKTIINKEKLKVSNNFNLMYNSLKYLKEEFIKN